MLEAKFIVEIRRQMQLCYDQTKSKKVRLAIVIMGNRKFELN
jgi:hypothetical protein